MTDDQGYGDIAAHGNPVIKTPNLDRLHRESVRLTEFHASPTCAPTRAALLTGRHEFHSGVTHTILERERLAALRHHAAPGAETRRLHHRHLREVAPRRRRRPPARPSRLRPLVHPRRGGIGQTYPGSCGDVEGNRYVDPVIRSDGVFVATKGYCTDVFFDEAIAWMRGCRKNETPFFCMITPNAPHAPLDCPEGSDAVYLDLLEREGAGDPKQRAQIAKFYGMIENIDTNVGRLLAELDRLGMAEETLVVFTTDNGTATGASVSNAGMRGAKGTVWRGGTRVPSFWRWKGSLPEGVDVPVVTAHLDVLPTLCEIAAEIPPEVAAKLEGRSLVPLLRDATAVWPDRPLVTHQGRWKRGHAAASQFDNVRVREGRWSLVNVANRPDGWELYDVAADPGESQDVAHGNRDVVRRLTEFYDRWWAGVQGDLVNEDVDGPAENPFKVAYRRQQESTSATNPPAGKPAGKKSAGKQPAGRNQNAAGKQETPAEQFPPPTFADVAYGPHPKQVMHVWLAADATPARPARSSSSSMAEAGGRETGMPSSARCCRRCSRRASLSSRLNTGSSRRPWPKAFTRP